MLNLLQLTNYLVTYPLRRTISGNQIGTSQFKLLELLLQAIVIEVRDLRLSIEIVFAIVVANLRREFFDLLFGRHAVQLAFSATKTRGTLRR